MKLLHVIATMDPKGGGPCQGIRNTTEELIKLGVFREIVCLDDPDTDYLIEDRFPIHKLGPAKGVWGYSALLYGWLVKNLERFDVVILNGLWLYHGYALYKAFKKLKRTGKSNLPKFLIMPHGMLDPYFQKAPDRKLKAVRNWIYWKIIEGKIVNYSDGLLFTCQTEMLLAKQAFSPYHPKKQINVSYGVVLPPPYNVHMKDAFEEVCPAVAQERYLLYLSRIHKKKGIDLLLEAYKKILTESDTYIGYPKLVIAGPGIETPYGIRIRKIINDNPELKDTVYLAGMLTGDAKWGAFYGCDAFVLPSHQENFGIAIVESLACGKPVLISDQVNIWKEIEMYKAGFISKDTIEGTENMLRQWFELSDAEKSVMGGQALHCFNNCFDIKTASETLYKQLSILVSGKSVTITKNHA